jgi:hypothetical protein
MTISERLGSVERSTWASCSHSRARRVALGLAVEAVQIVQGEVRHGVSHGALLIIDRNSV